MTEQSLAALAGHDEGARVRLAALLEIERRDGLRAVRTEAQLLITNAITSDDRSAGLRDVVALLTEAVLTVAEHRRPRLGRLAFDRAEALEEATREDKGGNA